MTPALLAATTMKCTIPVLYYKDTTDYFLAEVSGWDGGN